MLGTFTLRRSTSSSNASSTRGSKRICDSAWTLPTLSRTHLPSRGARSHEALGEDAHRAGYEQASQRLAPVTTPLPSASLKPLEITFWHSHFKVLCQMTDGGAQVVMIFEHNIDMEFGFERRLRGIWPSLPQDDWDLIILSEYHPVIVAGRSEESCPIRISTGHTRSRVPRGRPSHPALRVLLLHRATPSPSLSPVAHKMAHDLTLKSDTREGTYGPRGGLLMDG
ncbi:hypothetical protein FIBSPDRAFT_902356 [Athelia psychrophila]|uniref:Uncharacterized protein n=1 Tax=Athelia psychrophila TaxID=1759441 RepID=A0A167XB62_9AGAM|nr:hypothetical protein FIBSPDRAFT_902356 [Fibularhizoctonia sp. CBS 109695]